MADRGELLATHHKILTTEPQQVILYARDFRDTEPSVALHPAAATAAAATVAIKSQGRAGPWVAGERF